jgi:Rrf2 family iron-sulfur cluster assembly transcriptional regulator
MRLTTKGRYAVTAMLDLAIHHQEQGSITLANISQRQYISLSYLEQLFARLRKGGLVSSTRGPGGGYRLSRPAEQISIAEIIMAVDENMDTTRCQGRQNCKETGECLSHQLWADLSERIKVFLAGITLAQVLDSRAKEVFEEATAAQQKKARKQVRVRSTQR